MLIIQDKILVNLEQTFSIVIGGQGDRYLICKGGGSLEQHLVFDNNADATKARNLVTTYHAEEKAYLFINHVLADQKELESAPKPKRKAGTSRK